MAVLAVVVLAVAVVLLPAGPPAWSQDSGDGISYDEYIRTFPPIPAAVHADLKDGKPLICWQAPDHPPAAELAYDPVIVGYRIYLLDRSLDQTLVGETATTCFHDTAAPSGATRRYVVTAVQRSGQESSWSEMLKVRVP